MFFPHVNELLFLLSFESRKKKKTTEFNTSANQSKVRRSDGKKQEVHVTDQNAGNTRANKSRSVYGLTPYWLKSGVRPFSQSMNERVSFTKKKTANVC